MMQKPVYQQKSTFADNFPIGSAQQESVLVLLNMLTFQLIKIS